MTQLLGLTVSIKNKERTLYSGKAGSLTSLNDRGEFDILPMHANFISLIKSYILLNKGTKDEQKFIISKGVLKVKEDKVEVLLGI
jgi:F0F1-type ATP synthase epsilon subunit